jgi:hypothetical protein
MLHPSTSRNGQPMTRPPPTRPEPTIDSDDYETPVPDADRAGQELAADGHSPRPATLARFSSVASRALSDWAQTNDVVDDPYISGLTDAVSSGDPLSYWSSLDPTDALPAPLVPRNVLTQMSRFLAVVRNVMVFVPVAITWLAISRATDAFGEYTASLPGGTQVNFFEFWQSGGDGVLAEEWRLGSVAMLAFVLISLIVFLTLASSSIGARGDYKHRRLEMQAEQVRLGVALQVGQELHRQRGNDPEVLSSEIASMIDLLMRAADRLEVASDRLGSTTGNADRISGSIQGLSQTFTSESSNAAAQIAAAVDAFTSAAVGLSQSINQDAASAIRLVVTELEDVGDQLHKTSSSVELGTMQLREDLEAIHQRVSQLYPEQR